MDTEHQKYLNCFCSMWKSQNCFLQSLKSCGYVKEQFAWRHYYWYLTNEGIQYLRDFLHLPPEIVPATLRRQTRPETARPRPKGELSSEKLILYMQNTNVVMSLLFNFVIKRKHSPNRKHCKNYTGKRTVHSHINNLQLVVFHLCAGLMTCSWIF